MLPALIINSCIGIFYFLPLPWIPSFIPSFRLVNVRGLKGNDRVLIIPLIFQPTPPPPPPKKVYHSIIRTRKFPCFYLCHSSPAPENVIAQNMHANDSVS